MAAYRHAGIRFFHGPENHRRSSLLKMSVRGFWCMTRRRLAREALFQNVEGDFSVIVQSASLRRSGRRNERSHRRTRETRARQTSARPSSHPRVSRRAIHFPVVRRLESRHAARGMSAEVRRSHVSPPAGANISRRRWHPLTLPLVPRSSNRTSARRSSRSSTRAASPGCSRTWRRRLRRAWCSRP